MKNIKDAMAEVRRGKNYNKYLKAARVRVKLAARVYDKRKEKDLTQKELAKKVYTTQKVISNIENADVNIGINLLNRITNVLDFNSEDFGVIFHCESILSFSNNWQPVEENTTKSFSLSVS